MTCRVKILYLLFIPSVFPTNIFWEGVDSSANKRHAIWQLYQGKCQWNVYLSESYYSFLLNFLLGWGIPLCMEQWSKRQSKSKQRCDAYRPANRHPDPSRQRQQRQSPRGMTPAQGTTYQRTSTALRAHTQFMSHI